jgi:hypothetical protein
MLFFFSACFFGLSYMSFLCFLVSYLLYRHEKLSSSSHNNKTYEVFPIERFCKCLEEFKKRQTFLGKKLLFVLFLSLLFCLPLALSLSFHSLDETIYSPEFQFHYDDLLSVRLKFQRSFRKYEGTLDLYFTYLKQYQHLFQQLYDFRQKYQQVNFCVSFVSFSLFLFCFLCSL